MDSIPLDKAELLAIFLETLLYGVFLSLYLMLLVVLHRRGAAGSAKRRVALPIASALFALATAHLIIDVVRIFSAFCHEPGGPVLYFSNISHPLFTAKSVLYVTQTLIGDGVMIWRCYVLFNGKPWVVVLPGLGQVANTCVGYILISQQSRAPPGATVFQTASSLVTTFFTLTMCINVCCTAAIAWRIHATGRFAGGSKNMMHVFVAIVESGALYSMSVLALLIAYLERSNGQYPALDLIQPLIGITFSLMILRIHFHLDSPNHTTCGLETIPRRYMWTPNGPRATRDDIGYPMHSLAVQVTEETSIGFPVEEVKKVSSEDLAGCDGGADERQYTRSPLSL